MHRTAILLTFALLLVLSATSPAHAMVKFDVMLSGVSFSDSEIDRMVELVGDVQTACAEVLGVSYCINQTVNLRVFGNLAEFQKYGGEKLSALGQVVGFYHTRPMEVVVWAQNSKERMISTLLHECTHLFLHLGAPQIPIGLNEGLAEFFENATLDNGSFHIDPSATWDMISKVALSRNSLPDLDVFLNLSRQEWQRLDAAKIPVRAVSWSLASWLMETSDGQRTLARFLNSLDRPGHLYPDGLLAQASGKKIPELAREWGKWIPGVRAPVTLSISSAGKSGRGVVFRQ